MKLSQLFFSFSALIILLSFCSGNIQAQGQLQRGQHYWRDQIRQQVQNFEKTKKSKKEFKNELLKVLLSMLRESTQEQRGFTEGILRNQGANLFYHVTLGNTRSFKIFLLSIFKFHTLHSLRSLYRFQDQTGDETIARVFYTVFHLYPTHEAYIHRLRTLLTATLETDQRAWPWSPKGKSIILTIIKSINMNLKWAKSWREARTRNLSREKLRRLAKFKTRFQRNGGPELKAYMKAHIKSLKRKAHIKSLKRSQNLIKSINTLASGLSSSTSPTVDNAEKIIDIAVSSHSREVRVRAAYVLRAAISSYSSPTQAVAEMMTKLCQDDKACALTAIRSLSKGISSSTSPTVVVSESIVEIVKKAPHESVKKLAIETLSEGISSYSSPTKQCSAAIKEISGL